MRIYEIWPRASIFSKRDFSDSFLTAAHVVEEKNAFYAVFFNKDPTPRRVQREPFYLDSVGNNYGVDLALITLDSNDYPADIQAAKRCESSCLPGEEVFGHAAGFGCFYYAFDDQSPMAVILPNGKYAHVYAGSYQIVASTSEQHTLAVDGLDKDSKLELCEKMGDQYLLSFSSE